MHIVLFGARGSIGSAIASEALSRGHSVTGVVRNGADAPTATGLRLVAGNALDVASVATVVRGADAVVSATAPRAEDGPTALNDAARALIRGLTTAGVKRLIIVGGAGSLYVAPGLQLMDAPTFPEAYKAIAVAHNAMLQVIKAEAGALDWTYFSPAAMIGPGPRTGVFRVGADQFLADAGGNSAISIADYAVALVDELENGANKRRQMTAAY